MHPKDDTRTRLLLAENLCLDASDMPGIPERRRALLLQMREWAKHPEVPFHERFKEVAALEAEIKAVVAFCQVDRRIRQSEPAALQEPYPGSGMYRTGKGSETSGNPDASV